MTLISWSIDFALYLYLIEKCHTLGISSMWHEEWPQYICRSMWPIFHSPMIMPFISIEDYLIMPYISMTILWRNVIPWILVPCDMKAELKIYSCQCDLYFMVQSFLLIFWRLWWTNIIPWVLLVPYDTKSNLKIYVGHCDLHFPVQWFYLISQRLFDIEMSNLDFNFHVTCWLT